MSTAQKRREITLLVQTITCRNGCLMCHPGDAGVAGWGAGQSLCSIRRHLVCVSVWQWANASGSLWKLSQLAKSTWTFLLQDMESHVLCACNVADTSTCSHLFRHVGVRDHLFIGALSSFFTYDNSAWCRLWRGQRIQMGPHRLQWSKQSSRRTHDLQIERALN